ncbi:hypothetical protein [Spirillospora sp. NPDC048819]|uniref:hypothetical protein n=1 Tax=Spirillospora sp. NPDC048819 TaxID=3155268 RepID=UPI0033FE8D27
MRQEAVAGPSGTTRHHARARADDRRGWSRGGESPGQRLIDATTLVTADCPHSREPLARLVRTKGGHWLFSIKGNQPTIQANLAGWPWRELENLHLTR